MFTCPALSSLPAIRHGFFGREGGYSEGLYASLNCGYGSGDDIETVEKNRTVVAGELGAKTLLTAFQIHSNRVVTVTEPWAWKDSPEADALVTKTPGIALGALAADCLPILFADPIARVIGAAHSGWKGAVGGVIEATIDAMETLGAQRKNLYATIGPAISQASYEVGPEFRQRFLDESNAHESYFIAATRSGHHLFDLKSYARAKLEKAGIGHINVLAHDTCFEENAFFSYRRATIRSESVYGRQISAIVIK